MDEKEALKKLCPIQSRTCLGSRCMLWVETTWMDRRARIIKEDETSGYCGAFYASIGWG